MSVELFFETHQPYSGFRRMIELEARQEKPWSLLAWFAERMIASGKAGLSEHTKKLVLNSPEGLTPWVERFLLQQGRMDIGGVILGSFVLSINESIWDGQVDLNVLVGRISEGFKDTGFKTPQLTDRGREVELLSHEEYSKMVEAATSDKTLAVFFENLTLLPQKLQDFLYETQAIEYIDDVLPQYKARAKFLVEDP